MNTDIVVQGRQCGECTLCCTLMAVVALEKEPYRTCIHCQNGCAIYETRPDVCRGFLCGYLIDASIGEAWKPSQCHFIMVQRREENCVCVLVDPDHPDVWRKEPYYSSLIRLARKGAPFGGMVYVIVGDTKITLQPAP